MTQDRSSGWGTAPVLDDHLRGGGAAPGLAPVVVLRVLPHVDVLRVAGHRELTGGTGRAGRDGEAVGDVRGHRADAVDGGGQAGAGCPVEGEPQPVRDQSQSARRVVDREGVGPDGALPVRLVVDGGTPDVRVGRGPAAHDVPGGVRAVRVAAAQLDLDPGALRGGGVPGGDHLGGGDGRAMDRGGPARVLPGGGRAGVRVGVVGASGGGGDHQAGPAAGDRAGPCRGAAAPVGVGGPESVVHEGGCRLGRGGPGRGRARRSCGGDGACPGRERGGEHGPA